jgi:hypothetical protein
MGKVTTRDGTEIFDKDRGEGRPVVAAMFGPDGQRVLALIIRLPSLTADQVDQVTSAWKRGDPRGRAHAWAQLNRAATDEERHWILTAAALARREALETARRLDRADWAFWAAACDAAAAAAAGARLGPAYDTLVAPFAEVMPALRIAPAPGSATAPAEARQAAPAA